MSEVANSQSQEEWVRKKTKQQAPLSYYNCYVFFSYCYCSVQLTSKYN